MRTDKGQQPLSTCAQKTWTDYDKKYLLFLQFIISVKVQNIVYQMLFTLFILTMCIPSCFVCSSLFFTGLSSGLPKFTCPIFNCNSTRGCCHKFRQIHYRHKNCHTRAQTCTVCRWCVNIYISTQCIISAIIYKKYFTVPGHKMNYFKSETFPVNVINLYIICIIYIVSQISWDKHSGSHDKLQEESHLSLLIKYKIEAQWWIDLPPLLTATIKLYTV